ncbi:uncharacterized protein L969DRAFT_48944, partial [Mixia osmundae IAM 14324]
HLDKIANTSPHLVDHSVGSHGLTIQGSRSQIYYPSHANSVGSQGAHTPA